MEEIVGKFKKEVDGGHVSGPHMVPTAFFVHFPIGSCAPPPSPQDLCGFRLIHHLSYTGETMKQKAKDLIACIEGLLVPIHYCFEV